ncbi:serine/threonine protein kinase [Corallococcus sp. H22C18031201]|nr:serine/threonine protein kinase [Corallococcus sp. H22C18031201]
MIAVSQADVPELSIDGWRVLKELGNGGFAVVVLGEKNGRRAAIKLARHREESGDEKQTHARVLREVTALLLLDHPNIVKHQGYGYTERGGLYLVLEYVEGWTLAEWLERKHPTIREILQAFESLASAMSYMHGRGILHRDLKLLNVLIRKSDGQPVIIDFSCATHGAAEDLTDEGLPPGTDRYRAPEQFRWLREHRDEHRARYAYQVADEIFALGVMLYELLTDPRPTKVDVRFGVNSPVASPPPARALNARVPEALSDLVECILSRDPTKRPVDTEVLRRELGELLADPADAYLSPAHPPSHQLQGEKGGAGEVAPLALPVDSLRPRAARSKVRALLEGIVVALVLAVLVGGAGAWLQSGKQASSPPPERPQMASPAPISGPPRSPPPAMSIEPIPQSGPAAGQGQQKEGPTVKTPSEVATDRRGARAQPTRSAALAECATMTLVAALAAGCPGAQIRPESFTCPAGAQDAMREDLHWPEGENFVLTLDATHDPDSDVWFVAGGDVVGIVPKGVPAPQRALAPPGTRFFGKAYFLSDKMGRSEGPALVIRYDRVKLPGQDERPVCFVAERPAKEYTDGRVRARNVGSGDVVSRWP